MIKVEFHAQAWVRNYAVDVAPAGETEYVVADEEARALTGHDGEWDEFEADSFYGDQLQRASSAPKWVQDWSGPFYIEITGEADEQVVGPVSVAERSEKERPHIVLMGSPMTGFDVFGPFARRLDATNWADGALDDGDWWAVPARAPESLTQA